MASIGQTGLEPVCQPSVGDDRQSRRSRRLEAFHPSFARAIQTLTADSGPLEDLAESFPALLFALATGHGRERQRARTISLVLNGRPLREAADALGLPWWLRKLPAGAFSTPLTALPTDPEFAAAVVDFIPERTAAAQVWLLRVLAANTGCHSAFALWIARNYRSSTVPSEDPMLRYLAAWAWHAGQPGTPGHAILNRPWTPEMGLRRALDEAMIWRRRAALAFCLGPGAQFSWLSDGHANGLDFVTLRTVEDFLTEASAMGNCLDQFADHMETGATCVVSIRRNGRRLADVEIGVRDRQAGVPEILQLRAPRNRRAAPELWRATYAWLGSQPLVQVSVDQTMPAKRRQNRRRFWQPYLASLPQAERQLASDILLGERQKSRMSVEPLVLARPRLLRMLTARLGAQH